MNPTPDMQAILHKYRDDGFAVVRRFLDAREHDAIDAAVQHVTTTVAPSLAIGEVYQEGETTQAIRSMFHLEKHSDFFRDLQRHARLLTLSRTLLEDPQAALGTIMYFGKPAREGSLTPPHQDNFYQCFVPPEAMRITIAIDASTADNGPLTCQRGSHQLGVLPHKPSDVLGFSQILAETPDKLRYPEIEICLEPGDICVHATNTVHFSRPNTTDRSRRQLAIECSSTRAQQDQALLRQRHQAVKALHRKKG